MVLDEVYVYVGNKTNKAYIWTCLAKIGNTFYKYFHLSHTRNVEALFDFNTKLPHTNVIYSDCNFTYANVYGTKNIAEKGIKTNLIESLNSRLRQYCSRIRRRTKGYTKSFENLRNYLAFLFLNL